MGRSGGLGRSPATATRFGKVKINETNKTERIGIFRITIFGVISPLKLEEFIVKLPATPASKTVPNMKGRMAIEPRKNARSNKK